MPSATARSLRLLRKSLASLAEPATLDFWAREFGSIASPQRMLARVVDKRTECARAVTLELQPNRRFPGFQPGQHVNLTVEIAGRRHTRSYSLTGVPRADGRLSLTVQAVDGGIVSQHVFTQLAVGDTVELSAPFGELLLPETLDAPVLLLAAGSGITPLMSLTRELAARGFPVPVTLVYWARQRADLCFLPELRALAAREARFTLRLALTGESVTATDELRERPSVALLEAAVPDLRQRRVYACGPAGFVQQIDQCVRGAVHSFASESFTPPVFAPAVESSEVTVMLARSNRVLRVPTGQPLLAALEAQGVKPAYGCRMGICNSCACPKREGVTRDLKNGGDSAAPEANLRICINSAQSDLTLDL